MAAAGEADFPELALPPSSPKFSPKSSNARKTATTNYAGAVMSAPPPPATRLSAHSPPRPPQGSGLSPKIAAKSGKRSSALTFDEWVDSGRSVAVDYARARGRAKTFACGRNKLLQEATIAYRAGRRDVAKSLSAQGQALNTQMKECHKEAARFIFGQRNSQGSLSRGQMDLHGLHVAEAQAALQDLLPALALALAPSAHGETHVTIVTGSGHHSVSNTQTPRLLTAVQAELDSMGLRYQLVRDANKYTSAVRVRLK